MIKKTGILDKSVKSNLWCKTIVYGVNKDLRCLPFHCVNLSCFTTSSALNHMSLDSGGRMYGNCVSSPSNNTYTHNVIMTTNHHSKKYVSK